MEKYIIRCDKAGVFYAGIKSRNGSEATLVDAQRIHYWQNATECIGLATSGTALGPGTRITVAVEEMEVLGVIEVIPVTAEAGARLDAVKEWTL